MPAAQLVGVGLPTGQYVPSGCQDKIRTRNPWQIGACTRRQIKAMRSRGGRVQIRFAYANNAFTGQVAQKADGGQHGLICVRAAWARLRCACSLHTQIAVHAGAALGAAHAGRERACRTESAPALTSGGGVRAWQARPARRLSWIQIGRAWDRISCPWRANTACTAVAGACLLVVCACTALRKGHGQAPYPRRCTESTGRAWGALSRPQGLTERSGGADEATICDQPWITIVGSGSTAVHKGLAGPPKSDKSRVEGMRWQMCGRLGGMVFGSVARSAPW